MLRRLANAAAVTYLLLLILTQAAEAQTITNVRLVTTGTPNKGIVEVQLSTGTWGRLCDGGFDNNGASIVCAMLGYRPVEGFKVTGLPADTSGAPTAVAVVTSCSRFSISDTNTWTLASSCDYSTGSSIPSSCSSRSLDSAVVCNSALTTSTTQPFTGTTQAPNMATLAPTSCSNITNLQLLPGPNEGLVLIRQTDTDAFGTVCSVNFGANEARAICSMLCQGTVSAISQSGKYTNESAAYSVALSGLTCPNTANHTNDCTHDGWGVSTSPCSSNLAVSVRCTQIVATPPPAPTATVECRDNTAFVYFSISQVSSSNLLTLSGTYNNETCAFNATQNDTTVWAEIPYSGCNTQITANDTHTLYTAYLLKDVTAVNGVYFEAPYIYPVVCAINKLGFATAQMAPNAPTVAPISGSDNFPSDVALFENYADKTFTAQISAGQQLTIGSRAYLRVRTTSPLAVKLVVRNCYATETSSGTGTSYYLVQNKCTSDSNILFVVDKKTVGINFIVMSFSNSASTSTQAYFFCDVTVCSETDTSERCVQSCGTSVRRRRRREAEEIEEDTSMHDGPFQLVDSFFSTSLAVSDSCASFALIAVATAALVVLRLA